MNILDILKKRSLDILLVVIVFTLFFISGSDKSDKLVSPGDVTTREFHSSQAAVTENMHTDVPQSGLPQSTPEPGAHRPEATPSATFTGGLPAAPGFTPNPNPYQELKDSFKQVEGGAVTTEAIIERNTYFKKLSEQLRDLQGEVSSESTGKKPDTNEVILSDDFPNQQNPEQNILEEDPEILDEILDEMELLQ